MLWAMAIATASADATKCNRMAAWQRSSCYFSVGYLQSGSKGYRIGVMRLAEYLSSDGAVTVKELAARIGVRSEAQVRQWQHGYADRQPSPQYCVAIEQATDGAVTRQDLRPSDWHKIWPELAAPSKEAADV